MWPGTSPATRPVLSLNDNKMLYMQHPPGYKAPNTGTHVLRLVKTLYGLKQSGCCWYQKLSSVFLSLGFKQCAVDQAMYFKVVVHKGELTVVVIHVDDCTIVATTIHLIKELKAGLSKHFKVTNLGELHWMLSIKVKCNHPGCIVHLSQRDTLTPFCTTTTSPTSSHFPCPWTTRSASPQTR